MRRLLLVHGLMALLAWAASARANGGGYTFGVSFTGTLAPFQPSGTEHVQILEERLDIALRRTDAAVVVHYTMRNHADRPVRVRFGFPVEAVRDDEVDEARPDDPAEHRKRSRGRAYQQLKDYAVTVGGARVKAELLFEPFAAGLVKPFPGSEALEGIAGWVVSEVTFPAAATVALEIRYAADYTGEATYVSDDVHWPAVSFAYRLSTGAVWKGPIARGTVTIRADGVPADEVDITAPADRFRRDGDRWVWTFRDLEPTLADDLIIHPIPGFLEVADYAHWGDEPRVIRTFLERDGKWGAGHQRFEARASSTLAPAKDHGFGAEHLAEATPAAPWCEGVRGLGVGEWVELTPASPSPLLALRISPGFRSWKRPELYAANGRPSRVEVRLNGEHRFVSTLGDEPTGQLIPVLGYAKPASSVRITILEARPGAKYQDTCISTVVLYDRLTQKPEMRGAR